MLQKLKIGFCEVNLMTFSFHYVWTVGGVPQRRPSWGEGGGSEAGRGGGDGSEDGVQRLHDTQLQQQIVAALRRLREDMKSVMDRLEVVERLAATHVSRVPSFRRSKTHFYIYLYLCF